MRCCQGTGSTDSVHLAGGIVLCPNVDVARRIDDGTGSIAGRGRRDSRDRTGCGESTRTRGPSRAPGPSRAGFAVIRIEAVEVLIESRVNAIDGSAVSAELWTREVLGGRGRRIGRNIVPDLQCR